MRRRLATLIGLVGACTLLAIGVIVREPGGTGTVATGGAPSPAVITAAPPSSGSPDPTGTTTTTMTGPTTTTAGLSTTTAGPTTTTTGPTTTSTTMAKPTTTTTRLPVTTTRPAPPSTTTTTAPAGLQRGAFGPQVTVLQQRLSELGYWVGAIDGRFGDNTSHAVVALQKAAALPRTGILNAATAAALDSGLRPAARTTSGRTVEIDLTHQLLLLVQDGQVEHIFDTSTGRPGLETPKGQFRIHNQIDTANYHGQYRPKQFYAPRDLAIHGYSSVPPSPYSHGCARVTIAAMDWLWAHGRIPVGTPVLIY